MPFNQFRIKKVNTWQISINSQEIDLSLVALHQYLAVSFAPFKIQRISSRIVVMVKREDLLRLFGLRLSLHKDMRVITSLSIRLGLLRITLNALRVENTFN